MERNFDIGITDVDFGLRAVPEAGMNHTAGFAKPCPAGPETRCFIEFCSGYQQRHFSEDPV